MRWVRELELGRLVRALRRRRGWRQADCSARADVHRSTWSLLERGHLDRMSLLVVRRCLAVLEVRLDLVPSWRGAELDRLLDEPHARLQAAWKGRLERWGWLVRAEVSFNRYGDRGRVDLLARHPGLGIVLVVEIKTLVPDAQSLLGALDVKVRVAPVMARTLAWHRPSAVVPLLIVADGSTNRDRIRRLAPLFGQFDLRGRRAMTWLREPGEAVDGLLIFSELRPANGSRVMAVGRHRVRRSGRDSSVDGALLPAAAASEGT